MERYVLICHPAEIYGPVCFLHVSSMEYVAFEPFQQLNSALHSGIVIFYLLHRTTSPSLGLHVYTCIWRHIRFPPYALRDPSFFSAISWEFKQNSMMALNQFYLKLQGTGETPAKLCFDGEAVRVNEKAWIVTERRSPVASALHAFPILSPAFILITTCIISCESVTRQIEKAAPGDRAPSICFPIDSYCATPAVRC